MELSQNQQKIVSALSNHPDGLGFNALKREAGLHNKVLDDNLRKLVAEGVVTKYKKGEERWQGTTYKTT